MPASSFEIESESLLSSPRRSSSSDNSSRSRITSPLCRKHQRSFQAIRGRLRTLIWMICAMVLLALAFNVLASAKMTALLSDEEEEETERKNDPRTNVMPTGSPLALWPVSMPVLAPILSPPTPKTTTTQSNHHGWDSSSSNNASSTEEAAYLVPALVPNASQLFIERWCDLTGVDWIPKDDWHIRAPAFLIPGAKYGGSTEVASVLSRHAQLVPTRHLDLGFFYESNFRRFVSPQEKTKVLAARTRMYARDYSSSTLQAHPEWMSMDSTPGYLFASSLVPRRILCVMPWVRLLIIVCNPVDRIWHHYQTAVTTRHLHLSLEEWIDRDLVLLETVINASSLPLQDVAWFDYGRQSVEAPLGRSLYEIQIRQWLQAFRAVGRNVAQDVYLARIEDLVADWDVESRKILEFLHLDTSVLLNPAPLLAFVNQTNNRMAPETRTRLEEFFRPYNKRMTKILKSYQVPNSGKFIGK